MRSYREENAAQLVSFLPILEYERKITIFFCILGASDLFSIVCVPILFNLGDVPASRGFFTLVSILNSIGQRADDVIILLTIDWFFHRVRTSLNVLHDAYGAAIVSHFCQNQQLLLSTKEPKTKNAVEKTKQTKEVENIPDSTVADTSRSTSPMISYEVNNSSKPAQSVKFLPVTFAIPNGDPWNGRGSLKYVNSTWCCNSPSPIN